MMTKINDISFTAEVLCIKICFIVHLLFVFLWILLWQKLYDIKENFIV